jgi:hypothetical protein
MVFGCKTAFIVRRDEGSMAGSNVICLRVSQLDRRLNSGSGGHWYALATPLGVIRAGSISWASKWPTVLASGRWDESTRHRSLSTGLLFGQQLFD